MNSRRTTSAKRFLVLLLLSVVCLPAIFSKPLPQTQVEGNNNQQKSIYGKVVDDNNLPVEGVSIVVKPSNNTTSTNADGTFNLNIESNDRSITFSSIGFTTITQAIEANSDYNIVMQSKVEADDLDEVVVIGYGTQSRKDITGSVSIVGADELEARKPVRVEQALQGSAAGVQVTPTSGEPGGGLNIRIRGISTNGDARPLIIVDNAITEDLNVINPDDIESITILKDPSYASIYGVRAANGVILVTTKSGKKKSKLSIKYSNFYGLQQAERRIPVLGSIGYSALVNESFVNAGQNPRFPGLRDITTNTNWQDEVLQWAGMFQQNISISKGWDKITALISGSTITQDGIVGGGKANFTRYTGRANINIFPIKGLKIQTNSSYSSVNNQTLLQNDLGSPLFNALNLPPTLSVYDDEGNYTLPELQVGNEVVNPIQQIDNTHNRSITNRFSGSYIATYNFLDGFNVEGRFLINNANVNTINFVPSQFYGANKTLNETERNNRVIKRDETFIDYQITAKAGYSKTIAEKHEINTFVGWEFYRTYKALDRQRTGTGLPYQFIGYNNLNVRDAREIIVENLLLWEVRLLSFLGRLQYSYDKKYLFNATFRRDGSSRFGSRNRFGNFPSVSLGWIVSEENFISKNKVGDFINFLKFRFSWGINGSDRIAGTVQAPVLDNNRGIARYVLGGPLISIGAAVDGPLPNPSLKWEETEAIDIGLDINVWENRINFTADYYQRTTRNLLVTPQISGILGAEAPGRFAPPVNAGTIKNSGFEFSLGYNQKIGKDFSFSFNVNFTTIQNNTVFVGSENGFLEDAEFGVGQLPPSRFEAGFPIGYFYGFQTDGVFQNQEEVDNYAVYPIRDPSTQETFARPGELRFVDIDGNGTINDDDRTMIGSPIPDYILGFNLSINYKDFDFQIYGNGSFGNEIVRNYERFRPEANRGTYWLDRFTTDGSSNRTPYVTSGATYTTRFSSFFVEDGSFFKIQTIQLGYTLPKNLLKRIYIKNFRVFVGVNNVYTFTKYRGYDPSFTTDAPIGAGIDGGFYPGARIFLTGVNISF